MAEPPRETKIGIFLLASAIGAKVVPNAEGATGAPSFADECLEVKVQGGGDPGRFSDLSLRPKTG